MVCWWGETWCVYEEKLGACLWGETWCVCGGKLGVFVGGNLIYKRLWLLFRVRWKMDFIDES